MKAGVRGILPRRLVAQDFDGRNEAIPALRDGFDVLDAARAVAERLSTA